MADTATAPAPAAVAEKSPEKKLAGNVRAKNLTRRIKIIRRKFFVTSRQWCSTFLRKVVEKIVK